MCDVVLCVTPDTLTRIMHPDNTVVILNKFNQIRLTSGVIFEGFIEHKSFNC